MTELNYRFTYDTLFKMLFVQTPEVLKSLVAAILQIAPEHIAEFKITNPEIPPESLGDKFCRLDINMIVDGQRINLEVQVADEGDYAERSLYHWAREYSSALKAGSSYAELPRVIIISLLDFSLFTCKEYHSEYYPLEVTRHERLSDKMTMHYFELQKLPKDIDVKNQLELLLSLFRAKTEEDLRWLEELEVPVVTEAIGAYREITISPEFRELERLRADARHNEASALQHAAKQAAKVEREKWQVVVSNKEVEFAETLAETVAEKEATLAEKEATLAEKEAEIARLRALLGDA
ncbi:hypothetical protein FACS1894111_06250 [Clostridia bacterium]|nr:hypothetical protein FACS1894111_06250 [Clostridia bacterium]